MKVKNSVGSGYPFYFLEVILYIYSFQLVGPRDWISSLTSFIITVLVKELENKLFTPFHIWKSY